MQHDLKTGSPQQSHRELYQEMVDEGRLLPDVDLADPWTGYDTAIELARNEVLTSAPGERFVYSDINFFLLADIVSRVAGMPFDRFVQERLAVPLGMRDTMFNPPAICATGMGGWAVKYSLPSRPDSSAVTATSAAPAAAAS